MGPAFFGRARDRHCDRQCLSFWHHSPRPPGPSEAAVTTADIGGVIRMRRRELGLDQHELAAMVGVSRQWVLAIERGKDRADLSLVLRTLRVLGLAIRVAPLDDDDDSLNLDAVIDRARKP
jgi:HTH-type transcriptional regulator / antitoxin HipB